MGIMENGIYYMGLYRVQGLVSEVLKGGYIGDNYRVC